MNTEATGKNARQATGWVFYDGHCAFCLVWVRRGKRMLAHRGFKFATLQDRRENWHPVSAIGEMTHPVFTEMVLELPNGRELGGADAAIEIVRHIWWLWPLWFVSRIPGAMVPLRVGYRCIARNRHCTSGARAVPKRTDWFAWLPLVLLPIATLPLRDYLPNWIFMWLFVTAMFAGCKWLTWRRARRMNVPSARCSLGYLFAWPGMDANAFLFSKHNSKPKLGEWLLTAGRFITGVALVWLAAKASFTTQPVLNAWIGMFGLTLILHFGLFHLVTLAWQRVGVAAKPLMNSPLAATSLANFWGARWNTAFNKLIHDLAFRPLARRTGIAWATMGVFAISGIIHELSISFPARGGYGLPFGYFIFQGAGVLLERSKAGRALGLGHSVRGWLFMLTFTAGPAYWLFHPTFVRNVILPMLQTIGTI